MREKQISFKRIFFFISFDLMFVLSLVFLLEIAKKNLPFLLQGDHELLLNRRFACLLHASHSPPFLVIEEKWSI